MRIVKFRAEKLFGRFDYEIDLDPPSGNTIITAPNGYGKSTILRILQNFASGDYYYFIRESYAILEFTFSEGPPLTIYKTLDDKKKQLVSFSRGKLFSKLGDPFEDNIDESIYFIERELDFLTRVGYTTWKHDVSGEILDRLDVLARYGGKSNLRHRFRAIDWVEDLRAQLSIYSIPTNRLKEGEAPSAQSSMVTLIARDIAELIKDTIRNQFKIGREKETSFPARIIDSLKSGEAPSEESIKQSIAAVQNHESRYKRLGLLPKDSSTTHLSNQTEISDHATRVVLKTYLDDIHHKFSELAAVASKLEVFTKSINSLFAFTTAWPSADGGIVIRAKDGEKEPLSLAALSSGEQHLLVILGKLVFETKPGSLVLIDEPEISFHPEWQEKFLDILESIREINGFSTVVATHSPMVIGHRWDDTVELADLYTQHS
ncbi:AAA family ATPase [Pseudomonas sp. NY15374]|uniref:AAA family ATPase n=1 Tax=Pseudomonas sp. NY15374 TaxID=3400357 RepID=UPI003A88C190